MGPPIAWRRLAVEVAAIVLSILAAFAIDAWWDFRSELLEEREILLGLHTEFTEVASRLEGWAAYNSQKADLLDRMLALEPGAFADAAADSLISSMPFVNVLDRGGGTLDALLSSGRLELVRSRELRESLARWPDRMEDIHTNDLSIRGYVWGSVLPYMAGVGVPDDGCLGEIPFCVHSEGLPTAYRQLLSDQTFRSLLAHPRVLLPMVADDHRGAAAEARRLIQLVDAALSG